MTDIGKWEGILDLATKWQFTEIRDEAIAVLTTELVGTKNALRKIQLARKYDIESWLPDAYIELVEKEDLTLDELSQDPAYPLDWETISKFFYIREKCGIGYGSKIACRRRSNKVET
ncbi:hypothetical protein JR316_0000216 [Psilocybe cubensis]|uniref:Uncharacterized protein n=1 Tax=Psilocybe cubensis TaxID=181762 RepID=A0ACB8HEM0_PSICU|nr:hypothetical protein JR316_0000216 [Psilocybe cubensis]KAH9486152.1 hypothetical protein JR316_0000216 [Psilocybe cubensis]